jgi:hypothetical protein
MEPLSNVPATQQERAWGTPIWYTPTASARQSDSRGVTVTELKQKGAVALDDAQLTQLVVGRTLKIRNTVTGQRFEILYGRDGRRVITSLDGKEETPGDRPAMSELAHAAKPAAYEIRGGRIATMLRGGAVRLGDLQDGPKVCRCAQQRIHLRELRN